MEIGMQNRCMSRRLTALKLLEHGPLTVPEFVEIAGVGWHYRTTQRLLRNLFLEGMLEQRKRGLYQLKTFSAVDCGFLENCRTHAISRDKREPGRPSCLDNDCPRQRPA